MTGNLNLDRVNEKMADVKEALSILAEYAKLPDDDFLQNRERIRSARYSFIMMAEAATNIASHLCARIFNKAPVTYRIRAGKPTGLLLCITHSLCHIVPLRKGAW